MCQAKLEEESVRRGFKSSVVSEYITNLAKEISKQHVENANWLILVAYVRVLEKKKKKKKSQKRMDQFSSKIQRKHYGPKTVSPGDKGFQIRCLRQRSNQDCIWRTPCENLSESRGIL